MNKSIGIIVDEIREEYNLALSDDTYINKYEAAYNNAYNLALHRAYHLISGQLQHLYDIKSIHHMQAKILMELAGIREED